MTTYLRYLNFPYVVNPTHLVLYSLLTMSTTLFLCSRSVAQCIRSRGEDPQLYFLFHGQELFCVYRCWTSSCNTTEGGKMAHAHTVIMVKGSNHYHKSYGFSAQNCRHLSTCVHNDGFISYAWWIHLESMLPSRFGEVIWLQGRYAICKYVIYVCINSILSEFHR